MTNVYRVIREDNGNKELIQVESTKDLLTEIRLNFSRQDCAIQYSVVKEGMWQIFY